MTLKHLELYFIEELISQYGAEEAAQMFNLTIQHVAGLNRTQVMLQRDISITPELESTYISILSALKKGQPLQHIFAEAWFYGLKFKVNSSVLIPRPETEELVQWILATAPSSTFTNLLDVGTGSGCIAITLKKYLGAVKADALDISSEALLLAKENALANDVDINFLLGDIMGYEGIASYDLIVSNPPYITPKERFQMHDNVLDHEPGLALFVTEENPLIFYKTIADFAVRHLRAKGFLFFEINEHLAKEMIDMLQVKGFTDIELRKDMQGKDRMIKCNLDKIKTA